MNFTVTLNWKSFAAMGLSAIGIIFALKMDPEQAKEVSIHTVDACKDLRSNKNAD